MFYSIVLCSGRVNGCVCLKKKEGFGNTEAEEIREFREHCVTVCLFRLLFVSVHHKQAELLKIILVTLQEMKLLLRFLVSFLVQIILKFSNQEAFSGQAKNTEIIWQNKVGFL